MAAAQPRVENEAFVTLATNDTYALGALVLANSLRSVGTTRMLAVMITPGVSQGMRQQLAVVFDLIQVVDVLDSQDSSNLQLLTRPDLGVTFTKLHCWRLTQYSKAVFMDADTLVLQNIDDLFEREELSAAPDVGWPDCFNSGVFVFRPSEETYQALLEFAMSHGSFDGGDQGLLNLFFSDWATKDISKRLPFLYNVVSQVFYSYLPAFKQFGKDVKVVHFIGAQKPWHQSYNVATHSVTPREGAGHSTDFLQQWWNVFMGKVQPTLDPGVDRNKSEHHPSCDTAAGLGYQRPGNVSSCIFRCPPIGTTTLHIYEEYPDPQPHLYREDMSSHEMTAPYVPPQVDTYYQQQSTDDGAPGTNFHRVENKDDRPFTHYEAFYSEPPMSQRDTYPNPHAEVYEARHFEQTLFEFNRQPETNDNFENDEPESSSLPTDDVSVSSVEQTVNNTNMVDASNQIDPSPNPATLVKSEQQSSTSTDFSVDQTGNTSSQAEERLEESVDEVSAAEKEPAVSQYSNDDKSGSSNADCTGDLSDMEDKGGTGNDDVYTHDGNDVSVENGEVGIEGQMATLQVSGRTYTEEELGNRQRQFDWERGQIDYLGIDSFDNILKKLDTTISKPSGANNAF